MKIERETAPTPTVTFGDLYSGEAFTLTDPVNANTLCLKISGDKYIFFIHNKEVRIIPITKDTPVFPQPQAKIVW
jgi:hypothetical protein